MYTIKFQTLRFCLKPRRIFLPHEFHPKNFDELFDKGPDLRAYRARLVRHPQDEVYFQEYLDLLDRTRIGGLTFFEIAVAAALADEPISIGSTWHDRYDLPLDTLHYIMWHRKSVNREQKAVYLTNLFIEEGVGWRDFVIVNKPSYEPKTPRFSHDHLFLRNKGSYKSLKPKIPDW